MTQPKANTGSRSARFQSRYDIRTLVDVAHAVARQANSTAPEQVTQKQWDAARAKAGYPGAPSARQVAVRLKLSWAEVLALALGGGDVDKALGRRFGEDEDPYLDGDDVRTALRTVALRLNKSRLTAAQYVAERERILARRSPGSEFYLPNRNQVERIAGSWDEALAIAGLGPKPRQAQRSGLAIVDALELVLEAHGCLPTRPELDRFVSANGLALARRDKPWAHYLAELRRRRSEWGRWTPASPPALELRPDYTTPVRLPADLPKRQKRGWAREECIAALVSLLNELPAKTRLTMRIYQTSANGRRDLPGLHALQRHAPFSEMVAEARKMRAADG
jgi:hypothetical protein